MSLEVFTVIYNFMCPDCKRINIGKKLYRAASAEAASHRMSSSVFRCIECSPKSDLRSGAKTYVYLADAADLANYPVEPDIA
jgi:hypothetical protein